MSIKSVNTILYCENWGEMVMFYKATLSFPVSFENDWFIEFKLAGESYVSLADARHTSTPYGHRKGVTLSIEVEDINKTLTYLKDAGLNPSPIKVIWGAKATEVHDPQGNRIEFWQGKRQRS